ncbi:MAG: DUF4105 domain-containing protein [Prevotella sp.]|nr:DUF4105 domain-containing protein [Prevotella sp.]
MKAFSFLPVLLAILAALPLRAVPTDSAAVPANPMDSVEIGLLTCAPHDEVYSLYGHTALRCHNLHSGEDLVFNYGIYNFKKPHFVLRFVFGLTDYELGVAPTLPFCNYYAQWGSQVTEQVLDLTGAEKQRLVEALRTNYLPQNRVYRYNFFYDNCSTRPRDMLERCIDGEVVYAPRPDYAPSFRQMVGTCTEGSHWATFGNDILLGVKADLATTQREQQFLPANLRHDIDRAVVVRDGVSRPLVKERRELVPAGVQTTSTVFPLRPIVCALLLLAVSLVVFGYEQMRHTVVRWFDVLLMVAAGLAGCILFVMLFSQHPTTSTNLQLLLLNPLPLLFVWQVVRGRRSRWFTISLCLTIAFLVCALWQDYAEGLEVVAVCLLLRYIRHAHDK